MFKRLLGLLLLTIMINQSFAEETVEFSSTQDRTAVVELFTSQGCSSCPPAEKWLNSLKQQKGLWSEFVPVAFHVDYWDRLGWPDPYASEQYSERQYQHRRQNNIRSVYTPGVVLNGDEWRGWVRKHRIDDASTNAGILSFKADNEKLQVQFDHTRKDVVLNVVLLGFGIDTHVERGENRNRVLRQEFVALSHEEYARNIDGMWEINLPKEKAGTAKEYAIALWVSSGNNIAPLQSTGYWIPSEWVES